jgi:hypothetical protein
MALEAIFLRCISTLRIYTHASRAAPRPTRRVCGARHAWVQRHTVMQKSVSIHAGTRLHRACSCMVQACPRGAMPNDMGRLVVCSSPYQVPASTHTFRSLYANEAHASLGGSQ